MTSTYGSMSRFCTVFSYKNGGQCSFARMFLKLVSFMDVSFRTTILQPYFEHIAFWIYLHLEDQPVSHCSNQDET